jgi:hypothetical protein
VSRPRNQVTNVPASDKFQRAIQRFDEENSRDPNAEFADGVHRPRELVYAERLTAWVMKLYPDAPEELKLAARCQHICRWMIPRERYERTKAGYLRWRNELKKFHAQKSGEILREAGYDDETIARVQALNLKKHFPQNENSRVLEDALCLVFLQYQFGELAAKSTEEQMINALRKSWNKMTPAGREHALKLEYTERERALLESALAT